MGVARILAVIALAAATLVGATSVQARRESAAPLSTIAAADLPSEARATLARIRDHGPLPYERDGATFGNYERMLPLEPRGYYHEYTVSTPGVRSRGARRIVCGGDKKSGTIPVCYYSDDHYQTFKQIRP